MEHAKATDPQSSDAGGDSKTAAKGKEPKVTKRQEARRAPPGLLKLRPVKWRKVVILNNLEEDREDLLHANPLQ
jgi:hypothetical protein